jgi:hypothetical protein
LAVAGGIVVSYRRRGASRDTRPIRRTVGDGFTRVDDLPLGETFEFEAEGADVHVVVMGPGTEWERYTLYALGTEQSIDINGTVYVSRRKIYPANLPTRGEESPPSG